MNELIPDLEHPLVEIASRMMRPDGQGGWNFEREDAMILEAAILQEKHDPRMPSALLGLFQVADELHREHGATAAAGVLLAVLGRVGPHLSLGTGAPEAMAEVVERVRAGMAALMGERPAIARAAASGDAPADTISASDLIQTNTKRIRS
jgi:hypothetical protein